MDTGRHERVPVAPDLPRREPYRTWPGSLIVLAIIVAYVGVWVVVDNETSPELRPVAAGTTQEITDGITYVPVDGYYVDRTDSSQSPSGATLVLSGPGSSVQIEVARWEGTLAEEVERQKGVYEAFGGSRLLDDDAAFSTPGGLNGTTFAFASQRNQGRVWISVDEDADRSVVISGVATDSVFTQSLPDFQAMLDSIRTERP